MVLNPKIVVAGAGSIGCFLGGWIAAHGADVTLLLRPWLGEQLDTHGIHVSHLHGKSFSNPETLTWVTDPAILGSADLILVTVKSGATESIGQLIMTHARPDTTVVTLQNGVDNLPKLRALLPKHKIVGGMVPFNVVQLGDGHFRQATTGELWLGAGGEELVAMFNRFAAPSRYHADIAAVHWGKLLLNLNNPIQTLSGLTLKEELSKHGYRMVLAGAMDEARAVYQAAGIDAKAVTKVPVHWLPAALRLPNWPFARVAKSTLDVDPVARSSMWEDLQKGRRTEIDEINGVIVKLGEKHSVPTPINSKLVSLIKFSEREGLKSYSPKELS